MAKMFHGHKKIWYFHSESHRIMRAILSRKVTLVTYSPSQFYFPLAHISLIYTPVIFFNGYNSLLKTSYMTGLLDFLVTIYPMHWLYTLRIIYSGVRSTLNDNKMKINKDILFITLFLNYQLPFYLIKKTNPRFQGHRHCIDRWGLWSSFTSVYIHFLDS